MKKGVKVKKQADGAEKKRPVPPLRQRALERMKRGRRDVSELQAEEAEELVQDLEIHQVELEIQNEDLRNALVELAEARDMYRDLYEFAPVGYLTVDGKRVIRQANLPAASLLGVERGRLIGTRLEKYAIQDGPDRIYLAMQQAAHSGSRHSCEVEFRRPDGSRFFGWVEVSQEDGAGGFRVVIGDLTGKKEAEKERDEILALLDAIFESAPIGLGFWDRDLRYVRLNRALAEINGLPVEEHLGRRIEEILPELSPDLVEVWEKVLRTGQPVVDLEIEGRTAAVHGEARSWVDNVFPVTVNDEILGVGCTVQDITELKRVQEQLRTLNQKLEQRVKERTRELEKSREQYRHRIDSIPHMVWSILADRTGEYCNRRTSDYLGVAPEEMKESHLWDALHPEDVERVHSAFEEMLRSGRPHRAEVRIRRGENGAYRWHEANTVPVRDEEGRVVRWLGTCTDIHERMVALEGFRQMSQVFREATVPILILDGRACVVEANEDAERVLGWTAHEITGKSVKTLLAPGWYGEFDRLLETSTYGDEDQNEETLLLTKKGKKVPALVSLSVLSEEGGGERSARIALIARDISRIKATEAALRSSEKALKEEKRKLEDKNIALREILEQVEEEKTRIREEVAAHIAEFVLPAVERIAESGSNPSRLAILRDALEDLGSPLGNSFRSGTAGLTAREKEVCRMLKGGLSSKEISRILDCSAQTVEKHRKNIRRKLGIVGTGTNLVAYLNGA
jgi:PAS domain S-box-containing protein